MEDNRRETRTKEISTVNQLSKELRDKVRSGCTIVSVAQCVEELVFNAIDAGANKIFVGVNMKTFKIDVEDDGCGLSKLDLELVGKRYVTSKWTTEEDLQRIQYYGYRGEALASIISVSKAVKLFSRPRKGCAVYRRWYRNGKGIETEVLKESKRPPGLTVTVEGLLENQPVRQKRLDRSMQLEDIRSSLEHIALINPTIGIVFRNESNMSTLLNYSPCFSHADAFDKLYSTKKQDSFSFITENHLQDGLMFTATIGRQMYRQKCFQFVFVNRRCIESRMKIHKIMNDFLIKVLTSEKTACVQDKSGKQFPVFILYITCSLDKYCPQRDSKFGVEFFDWDSCLKGIEGFILKFQRRVFPASSAVDLIVPFSLHKTQADNEQANNAKINLQTNSFEKPFIQDITTHNVRNAVHSRFVVRESQSPEMNPSSQKSQGSSLGHSQQSNLNLRSRPKKKTASQEIDDILSTTYSELDDSASALFGHIPYKKSTAKHTVYTVRRSQKVGNKKTQAGIDRRGAPRKDIVVPRKRTKPILNKDIFNRFPQWDEKLRLPNNAITKRRKVIANDSPSLIAIKKAKYSNLSYQQPYDILHLNDRTSKIVEKRVEPLDVADQEILYKIDADEPQGIDWKIQKFLYESQDSVASPGKDSLGVISDEEEHYSPHFPPQPRKGSESLITGKSLGSLSMKAKLSPASSEQSPLTEKSKTPNFVPVENTFTNIKNIPEEINIFTKLITESAEEFVSSRRLTLITDIENVLQRDLEAIESLPDNGGTANGDDDEEWGLWDFNVVSDANGQDWLETVEEGQTVFINLSTGDLSYDMVNFVKRDKATAMSLTKQKGFNWLRRYFPKGCDQLWKRDSSRKPQINGNITASTNHLSEKVKDCIVKSAEDIGDVLDKWRADALIGACNGQGPINISEYFSATSVPQWNSDMFLNGKTENKLYNSIMTKSMKFKKDDLKKLKVICQWDRKFIVAKLTIDDFDEHSDGIKGSKDILVLLDQHAVHERIRLERLIRELYKEDQPNGHKHMIGIRIEPPFTLYLMESETRVLDNCKETFKKIALDVQVVNNTTVKVSTAPTCILKKAMMEPTSTDHVRTLTKLLTSLIQEEVQKIVDTKTVTVTNIPKTIFNILCSQACHGAIKFGDELEFSVCEAMIEELQECQTPFQCAHGRPSMIPLMELSSFLHNSSATCSKTCDQLWREPQRPCSASSSSDMQSKPSTNFQDWLLNYQNTNLF